MWATKAKSRFLKLEVNDDAAPNKEGKPERKPRVGYNDLDAVLYVVTLCAAGAVVSLSWGLPWENVLGYNFVLGWFATDLLWSHNNPFVRFEDTKKDYLPYTVSIGAGVAAWSQLENSTAFMIFNAAAAALLLIYWVLTEDAPEGSNWLERGTTRVLGLYGFVTVIAGIVCYTNSLEFTVHAWYVAFVLNALATQRRQPHWYNRAFHGYTWSVLVYELGKGTLVFSQFFYG